MPKSRGQKVTFKLWLKSFTKLEIALSILLVLLISILVFLFALIARNQEGHASKQRQGSSRSGIKRSHMKPLMFKIVNDLNKEICVANLVALNWSLTVASCVESETPVSLKSDDGKSVAIEMIIVHPFHQDGGDEYDLAMVKSTQDTQNSDSSCAYLVSPRMEMMMTRYDMLATRFDIRDEKLIGQNHTLKGSVPGTPAFRGPAIYALSTENGNLVGVSNHIEWLEGCVGGY